MSLTEEIKREALALGFDAVGVSRVANSSQPSSELLPSLPPDPATEHPDMTEYRISRKESD